MLFSLSIFHYFCSLCPSLEIHASLASSSQTLFYAVANIKPKQSIVFLITIAVSVPGFPFGVFYLYCSMVQFRIHHLHLGTYHFHLLLNLCDNFYVIYLEFFL